MSGLPSGYTQLEYIQSSGTQYVDTGAKPDQTYTLEVQFQTAQTSAGGIAVSDENWQSNGFGIWCNAVAFGNQTSQDVTLYGADPIEVTLNRGGLVVNGERVWTPTAATFMAAANMTICALNRNGSIAEKLTGKIYYVRLLSNGQAVRDFVPCKNASGAVGLYDTVEGQFYANAGTGTFTAGPEVVYEPDAPTNFAASVSGQTVALSWASSANAAGYRLKRDGVQIADQTGTTYTDTVPDGTTLCTYALTAYNDAGESAAVTLLVLVQLELITDRTRADVANETDKGFYNASDLNRVGAAVEYIAGRFAALGYACPVTVKKDWLTSDAPTASQLETYRQNIVTLRSRIAVMQSTPEAPASMAGLNYVKANNIEMILLTLNFILNHIPAAVRHCGVTVCGGKGVRA